MGRNAASVVALTAAMSALISCSTSPDAAAPTATASPALDGRPQAVAPATTSTSTSTSTTTTPITTASPSTLPVLPTPIPPPPEDGSTEPRVEIGTIEIPRIALARTLFEGIRISTLDDGPGHWPGTAMPGTLGNVVVAGHRVSKNEDFRHLDRLVTGDEVIMTTRSGRHVYRVTAVEIVRPDALWIVDQTHEYRATLFACHPPGSIRERIVVHLALAA
jgi:sortase A